MNILLLLLLILSYLTFIVTSISTSKIHNGNRMLSVGVKARLQTNKFSTGLTMVQSPKKVPYGVSCFEDIVKNNFVYFDRTAAMKDIEDSGYYLKIWRPRRSGKSLFCDQLALYYDKQKALKAEKVRKCYLRNEIFLHRFSHENFDKSKYLQAFENTYIGQNPTPNRSSFLILYFSFSNVDTAGSLRDNFRDHVNRRIEDFSKRYKDILKEDIEINYHNHVDSMEQLFDVVGRADEEVYLIVDEYDSFANRLLLEIDTTVPDLGRAQYKSDVADKESLLRTFGNVLKTATRTVLKRMFFTGVTPMAFSDGLSSLNMVQDISDNPKFESLFGFSEDEVKLGLEQILPGKPTTEFIDTHLEIMRDNFNGYRFNTQQVARVFNPQMCLYYMNSLKVFGKPPVPLLDANIADPADNMAQFLVRNYRGTESVGVLELLRYKVGFPVDIAREVQTFRTSQLFDVATVDSALLALAYHHGYLTYCDPIDPIRLGCLVSPNKVYQEMFLDAIFSAKADVITKNILGTEEATSSDGLRKKIFSALKGKISDSLIDKILDLLGKRLFKLYYI